MVHDHARGQASFQMFYRVKTRVAKAKLGVRIGRGVRNRVRMCLNREMRVTSDTYMPSEEEGSWYEFMHGYMPESASDADSGNYRHYGP
ncbi:unnamed protein product [Microthlaspi erraticum]|uniref:Uncharacterized protein n=1 Tax=Microthlaspi erraticum TaxID=1685480 RepID=A0A6D2HPF2_9BRAS|nr:unnamed protein product [Microthlaspi erraticum]